MFLRKARAARLKFLIGHGLTISLADISDKKVVVFGFLILQGGREVRGEVWALLKPGPARFTNNDIIRDARVVAPMPSAMDVIELGKRLHVEVWDLASETRPMIRKRDA
jgi:hypothetical protein